MFYLAFSDQVFDCARDLFDGHRRIDTVLVEQIDTVGAQALQRGVSHCADMLWSTVEASPSGAGNQVDVETEFGGDHHLVADWLQGLAEQLFIAERSVGLGGVEQVHATFVGGADQFDHVLLVGGRAVDLSHVHAAKTECGHFQAIAQNAGFHWCLLVGNGGRSGSMTCVARLTFEVAVAYPFVHALHGFALLLALHHEPHQHLGLGCVTVEHGTAVA